MCDIYDLQEYETNEKEKYIEEREDWNKDRYLEYCNCD